MATIYLEISVESSAEKAWEAVKDFGALHERLVPGFVKDCRLDSEANGRVRVVTFFNDSVVHERLVGLHEPARRLAYTVVNGRAAHHNASVQIFADGPMRCRFVWITDVLPDEVATPIGAMVERGATVIKATLERRAAGE